MFHSLSRGLGGHGAFGSRRNAGALALIAVCGLGFSVPSAFGQPSMPKAEQDSTPVPARARRTEAAVDSAREAVDSAREAVERLFSASKPKPEWFTPDFLEAIPLEKLAALHADLRGSGGAFEKIEAREGTAPNAKEGDFVVTLEKEVLGVRAMVDDAGRLSYFLVQGTKPRFASLPDVARRVAALRGRASFLVRESEIGGAKRGAGAAKILASHASDVPLAVGSAFKLVVLDGLARAVEKGASRWEAIVPLLEGDKSYYSDLLRPWPAGTPFTAAVLSGLMISQSENNATDALVRYVGTPALEALSPRNTPFLTTRQAFLLKHAGNADLLSRWRKDPKPEARRAVLTALATRPVPAVPEIVPAHLPAAIDVEWHFTAEELCDVIDRVAPLPLMGINPGVADRSDWDRVAYKGGSEPGVLNLTTHVTLGNRAWCVVTTWNDGKAALDPGVLEGLHASALAGVRSAASPSGTGPSAK